MVEQRADNAQTVDRNHQEAPNLNTLTLESWAPLTRHRKVSFSVFKFDCSYTVIRGVSQKRNYCDGSRRTMR